MKSAVFIFTVLVAWLAACGLARATDPTTSGNRSEGLRPVMSMYEIRQSNLVRQQWDQSCGSAALATVLTYHLDTHTTETAIIGDIVRHGDPLRVRQRQGFSLLDLKRYVERRGMIGHGYGRLSLAELVAFNTAAIVPIRTHGYDHFVVLRGQIGDRVLLADPAFGNLSFTVRRFEQVWQNGIAFLVFHSEEDVDGGKRRNTFDARLPVPQMPVVADALRGLGPVPSTRVGR
jgi:predicted double-glycine peptidase